MTINNKKLQMIQPINGPIIGLVGGMGSYATAYFFEQMIDAFPAEKEWDRPHVIIDNFCTMPSRVKNIVVPNQKEIDTLISCLCYSVEKMIDLSRKLAGEFYFVRVDWMIYKEKFYFEELTFTPYSGYIKFKNKKYNLKLGKLINLENIK